jgi:hypothetical protein
MEFHEIRSKMYDWIKSCITDIRQY